MGHTLVGTWRFDSMELWDREAIDLLGPSFLTITADGMGSFRFIAVEGHIDCRFDAQGALPLVEFTWDGFDENRPVSGVAGCVMTPTGQPWAESFFTLATIPASR